MTVAEEGSHPDLNPENRRGGCFTAAYLITREQVGTRTLVVRVRLWRPPSLLLQFHQKLLPRQQCPGAEQLQ